MSGVPCTPRRGWYSWLQWRAGHALERPWPKALAWPWRANEPSGWGLSCMVMLQLRKRCVHPRHGNSAPECPEASDAEAGSSNTVVARSGRHPPAPTHADGLNTMTETSNLIRVHASTASAQSVVGPACCTPLSRLCFLCCCRWVGGGGGGGVVGRGGAGRRSR